MSIRRFTGEGFNPFEYEYKIRNAGMNRYEDISMEKLSVLLNRHTDADGDVSFMGGIMYKPKTEDVDFQRIDKLDFPILRDCLRDALDKLLQIEDTQAPEPEPAEAEAEVVEAEPVIENEGQEVIETSDIKTTKRAMQLHFCCRPMMQAMLGGSGAVTISMDTGALQVGGQDISKCPFCGCDVQCTAPEGSE